MRLIDADAIKLKKGFFEEVDNVPKLYEWLKEQPSIDPAENGGCWGCCCEKLGQAKQVKHGKWVIDKNMVMTCSVCGWIFEYYAGLEEEWNYCPHCGAKMDGEE